MLTWAVRKKTYVVAHSKVTVGFFIFFSTVWVSGCGFGSGEHWHYDCSWCCKFKILNVYNVDKSTLSSSVSKMQQKYIHRLHGTSFSKFKQKEMTFFWFLTYLCLLRNSVKTLNIHSWLGFSRSMHDNSYLHHAKREVLTAASVVSRGYLRSFALPVCSCL